MLRGVRPSLLLALSHLLVEGSAFLRNLILARLVGVEQMGLAVALALGIRLLEMLGDLGLERYLVQAPEATLRQVRGSVHLIQVVKGCLLTGIACLLAFPLCAAISPGLDPSIFILASLVLIIRGCINTDYRERQREQDFVATLYADGISNVIAVIAIIPLAMATRDYSALALASVLQATILCLASHLLAKRKMAFFFNREEFGKALKFGLPIAANGLLMFFALQGDRLVVTLHFPPEELARFAIAAQLTILPALMGARYLLTLDLPLYSRIKDRPTELRSRLENRLKQVSVTASLMAIFFIFLGEQMVGWLYGPAFVCVPTVMTLLAIAAALRLVRAVPNTVLLAQGKTMRLLACNAPRLVAFPVAVLLVLQGGGLVTVVVIGVLSEAAGLLMGLGMAATRIYGARPLMNNPSLESYR